MRICQAVSYFPYKEHIESFPVENEYHIGGVERHVYNLSIELNRLNHKVTVITTRSPNHDRLSEAVDFDVIRVPIDFRIYSSPVPLRVLNLSLEEFDVIHAHTPVPLIADLVAIKNLRERRRFVLTYHNDISKDGLLGRFIAGIYNCSFGSFLLKHSDIIITTTKSYALHSRQLRKYLYKVTVVPNGVDTRRFHPKLDKNKVREKYGIGEDAKVVLFVGNLEAYKGCEHLLSAFSMIMKEIKDVYLILVGKGSLESRLKETAAKLCIKNRVFFAGYVKDNELPYYYAACDVFVLPSISGHEGFGMVQLEAMACGKPVIVTNIPGVREVDAKELATIHIPPKSERALMKALLTVLRNEELAIKMGDNGRKIVEEYYSWPKIAGTILRLYEKHSTLL
jgi:glycosyltransferase involved in cell wall biosynthesis